MRFMRSVCVVVAMSGFVGCGSEQTFEKQEARLVVLPTLLDVGDVSVGDELEAFVQLDHAAGPAANVLNVVVTNFVGTAFRYDGDEAFVLDRDGSRQLSVVFAPVEVGWFTARISLAHDGVGSPVEVDVRGHGVSTASALGPLALEFGRVEPGASVIRTVTLTNTGAAPLTVTEASFTESVFALDLVLPTDVGAGATLALPIRFSPIDLLPAEGAFVAKSGAWVLGSVALRGNDCEAGLPEAYDVDTDGVTSCGGDCDDDDAGIRPGAPEVADGRDQDCDGLTDEGTSAVDDDGDGLSEDEGDCNDGEIAVTPGATEILGNGIDDDCDGIVDLGANDADGDGSASVGGDCDDADPSVHPGAPELGNGVDDDCDGIVDEGTAVYDDDGDGLSEDDGDCDDTDPDTRPGSPELSDGRDNDCDGLVDEGTTAADDDGDGYTEIGGDCDDADPAVSPGAGNCP